MAWRIKLSERADRKLSKLDAQPAKSILKCLKDRLAKLEDPRSIGKALQGSRFGDLWRHRLDDFRIVCKIEDRKLIVLVLRIGQRKEIYR